MRSKEYQEAADCYSKSLEIFEEAATYSNRAMAHLRLKIYSKTIEDSNNALRLDPNYLKAHHRRGKAYLATKKYEMAIKDFQAILEKEPENKDINHDLMDAREAFNNQPSGVEEVVEDEPAPKPKQAPKPAPVAEPAPVQPPVPKVEDQKFKRVMIEEDSDEEEEETTQAPPTPEVKKPLIQEVEKPATDFISQKDSNYSQFDLSKLDSLKENVEKLPAQTTDTDKIKAQMAELEAEKQALAD